MGEGSFGNWLPRVNSGVGRSPQRVLRAEDGAP